MSHRDVHGAVLFGTNPLVADFAIVAAGAVRPGKVSGLADQLSAGLPSAPQLGAGLHVGAGFGSGAEGQLTLTVQAVTGTGKVVWERQLLLRRIQQTVSCGTKRHLNEVRQLLSQEPDWSMVNSEGFGTREAACSSVKANSFTSRI